MKPAHVRHARRAIKQNADDMRIRALFFVKNRFSRLKLCRPTDSQLQRTESSDY
jgi:hypothetical protein